MPQKTAIISTVVGLNPYYSGRGFLSAIISLAGPIKISLNPYYSGRGFLSYEEYYEGDEYHLS